MFLSMIPNEEETTRYLERTAQRLRSMTAHTTGLEGADPAEVRGRLMARDRHARRQAAARAGAALSLAVRSRPLAARLCSRCGSRVRL